MNRSGYHLQLINISNAPQFRGLFKVDAPQYEALLNRIWQHSLATAACAQALAQKLSLNDPDATTPLLHDIAKGKYHSDYQHAARYRDAIKKVT